MTAEIAILNRSAVALAADSALTVSSGRGEDKVFDSEDKLFELTRHDPIGIMVNSGMTFMDAPLPVLIKRFRRRCARFDAVGDAAREFLGYLHRYSLDADDAVAEMDVRRSLAPAIASIKGKVAMRWAALLHAQATAGRLDLPGGVIAAKRRLLSSQIEALRRFVSGKEDALFLGEARDPAAFRAGLVRLARQEFGDADEEQHEQLADLGQLILSKRIPEYPHTGVVVAGFGREEMFPALTGFEVYGLVDGRLRYASTHEVRIGRDGAKAEVLPFAQKEMVDRFLFGLDDDLQRKVDGFCRSEAPKIGKNLLAELEMSDEDREHLSRVSERSVLGFFDGLAGDVFEAMRNVARAEMQDTLEYMPKSEMARMAESLVNLTSIKRRMSRGKETVGGPIDCAVISQADGFVWVKRKHYFPHELNHRFFERMREQAAGSMSDPDEGREAARD